MVDPKDKLTTPTSDAKPARSAAVKPPVLEGAARPAATKKPEPGTLEKPEEKPKLEHPAKPEPKPAMRPVADPARRSSFGPALLAGIVGGGLGLGGAFALALFGYWPAQTPPVAPADPRIAQLATAMPELQTIAHTVQSELSVLTDRVAALENREPAGVATTGVDLAPLSAEISALEARVDELATQAVSPNAENDDQLRSIAALKADLVALKQSATSAIDTVTARIAALEAQQQASVSLEENRVRLPLILSGFETAFAAGRSYDGELAALREALPDLPVPDTIAAAAMTGITRPDAIVEAFNAVLPDILAARPLDGEAGWQGATADWFRGVIALRPTGDVAGDDPEARIARLEAALARRDFALAQAEFLRLPEPMQAAAGVVAGDIAAQADAAAFLLALRQAALGNGGPA